MNVDRLYLVHILEAIDRIHEDAAEGEHAFFSDRRIQDAIIRNLAVVGEAVKSLSTELREAKPEVPWKAIAGMRDRLIHGYFGIDLQLVFKVVERDIPLLESTIRRLLEEL